MTGGVCDVPVIDRICEKVGEGAGAMISAPFEWLANGIAKTAAMLFEGVWILLAETTSVNVTSAGYVKVYNILFGIAVFVMLIFFCLQLITGLVRRDPSALSRAVLGLAKSVLGSFVVIGLTATLLELTDQLATAIVHATGTTMEQMGGRIGALAAGLVGLNISAPGVGAIVTIFLGSLAIVGAALVWFSLLIRKALLLVAIVLAPVALAGASWDATRGWISKWASFVLALIFSKLVVVVIFLVAVTQVSAPIAFDLAALSEPIAGIALMLIAGFAPYMCYKFISFIGLDMYQLTESERESKQAMNRPVPLPNAGGGRKRDADPVLDGQGNNTATLTSGAASNAGGGATPAAGAGTAAAGGAMPAVAAAGAAQTMTAGPRAGAAAGQAAEAQGGAAGTSQGTPGSPGSNVGADQSPAISPAGTPGPAPTGYTGQGPDAEAAGAAPTTARAPAPGPVPGGTADGVLERRQEDRS